MIKGDLIELNLEETTELWNLLSEYRDDTILWLECYIGNYSTNAESISVIIADVAFLLIWLEKDLEERYC